MPELAEVAVYARDLSEATAGRRLLKASFPNRRDWGVTIIPAAVKNALIAQTGNRLHFSSTGKVLHIHAANRKPLASLRLGMTGQFHLKPQTGKWRRHYFLVLHFEGVKIYYADPRRFGRMQGPLSTPLALGGFTTNGGFTASKKIVPPKGFLTQPRISWLLSTGDQTGVGNYMANEALGRLNLSPFEPCRSAREAIQILRKCCAIGAASFKHGGNSFGSGYYQLDGAEGRYARHCRFYQNPKLSRVNFRGRPVFSRCASVIKK